MLVHEYIRSWKQGEYEDWDYPIVTESKPTEVLRGVVQDQKTDLYVVFVDDLVEFEDWVAMTYASENDWQEDDESNRDYLDRIGVQIIQQRSTSGNLASWRYANEK
jgi:hypothetical protein